MVRTSATSSRMEPIVQVSKTQLGLSYFRGFGDTTIWKKPWMRMATPNDVSSNVNGLALRTRRKATASIAIEESVATTMQAGAKSHQGTPASDNTYTT